MEFLRIKFDNKEFEILSVFWHDESILSKDILRLWIKSSFILTWFIGGWIFFFGFELDNGVWIWSLNPRGILMFYISPITVISSMCENHKTHHFEIKIFLRSESRYLTANYNCLERGQLTGIWLAHQVVCQNLWVKWKKCKRQRGWANACLGVPPSSFWLIFQSVNECKNDSIIFSKSFTSCQKNEYAGAVLGQEEKGEP